MLLENDPAARLIAEHPNKTILGLSVKKQTTCLNVFAIAYIPFLDYAASAVYNTQVILLLKSPEYFSIP